MNKKEHPKSQTKLSLPRAIGSLQERDSSILILHYKMKMSVQSLSEIFSLGEPEVAGIIATFAEQFSNTSNLNNVVDCLIKMKKKKPTANGEATVITGTQLSKDNEIAELKRRLKESEIKAEAYLELIKGADQIFKIPIRKKYGAK